MHNAAFAVLEMNWAYLAFHVAPERLREALYGARDMGLAGVNLTVPHKVLALELAEVVDAEARKLGAVNTIHFRDGKLYGFNTDGHGFVKALREEFNLSLKGKRVLVLGAGGAGRAIAVKWKARRPWPWPTAPSPKSSRSPAKSPAPRPGSPGWR